MEALALHEFHHGLNAVFTEVSGMEVVDHYGDPVSEYRALHESAAVLDLSFRSRICLTGADRVRFLHGQVTNNVQGLRTGTGCYAALVTAKGKLQSDLNIYALKDELLLDFEPGLTKVVSERLEKYIIADDVQIIDVAAAYGQLSIQGPKSEAAIRSLGLDLEIPAQPLTLTSINNPNLGEIYLMNHPRTGGVGFDLFVPTPALGAVADKLIAAAKQQGGSAGGWTALERARIEAGLPRFGADMDETNLAPEAIEARAISYSKGCYIGQEVIARIRTYGQVAKALRGLRLDDKLKTLPAKGDKLFHDGKEVGYITSAVSSSKLNGNFALGYVRKEANQIGSELILRTGEGEFSSHIVEFPFKPA
ncbi:YgfZ/GcvT domain-containing protein [Pedosphaera parvula]|uniref:Folate-binding protein YgfZ n=1 Tax=Pedosphaera parvula (strain Ellin514) TaxID=320771 RepID=B9XH03_PEDPL|nr:glycine cleavage T C-terminal barrel domain-containing protein [Pedosphaera parvula]EEF60924.1 folate-binding protein YgfZ [Pedosphaera parvula Ellin514]